MEPTTAYFGQKDAAQCVLIRRLVQDLDMGIDIHIMDTIREADGLAMSSRNAYLPGPERAAAPVVYRSLCAARDLYFQQSQSPKTTTTTTLALQARVRQVLAQEPLISDVLYVAVDSRETMRPLETVERGTGAIVSLACKLGGVRLIDNIILE